jgi:hypothetical protein
VNSPKIDRRSLALHKEIMAKIRDEAEREMKKQMECMSKQEAAKLNRLLTNIKYLGDVGKAASKARVSRALLDKWMNTPGVSWRINTALNDAQALLHSGRTAKDVLWWSKIDPELQKDAEYFKATGQRSRESKIIAKLVAQDLKANRWHIIQAANNRDKYFFIDLGRILSGEASGELYDALDADVAELFVKNPGLSTHKAVVELEKRGHSKVNEEVVRQRKKRLGLSKSFPLQIVTKPPG